MKRATRNNSLLLFGVLSLFAANKGQCDSPPPKAVDASEYLELHPERPCPMKVTGQENYVLTASTTMKNGHPIYVGVDNDCNQLDRYLHFVDEWSISDHPYYPNANYTIEGDITCDILTNATYDTTPAPSRIKMDYHRSKCAVRKLKAEEKLEVDLQGNTCEMRIGGEEEEHFWLQTTERKLGAPVFVGLDRNCQQISRFLYKAWTDDGVRRWKIDYAWKWDSCQCAKNVGSVGINAGDSQCPLDGNPRAIRREEGQMMGIGIVEPGFTCPTNLPKLPVAVQLDPAAPCPMRIVGHENFDLVATSTSLYGAPIFVGVDEQCNQLKRFVYKKSDGEWQIDEDTDGNIYARLGFLYEKYDTCPDNGAKAAYWVDGKPSPVAGIIHTPRSKCAPQA